MTPPNHVVCVPPPNRSEPSSDATVITITLLLEPGAAPAVDTQPQVFLDILPRPHRRFCSHARSGNIQNSAKSNGNGNNHNAHILFVQPSPPNMTERKRPWLPALTTSLLLRHSIILNSILL